MNQDNSYVELPSQKVKELVDNCIKYINESKQAQITSNVNYARKTLTKELNAWYRIWKRNPTEKEIDERAKFLDRIYTGKYFLNQSIIDDTYASLEFLCSALRNAANIADSVLINVYDLRKIS